MTDFQKAFDSVPHNWI